MVGLHMFDLQEQIFEKKLSRLDLYNFVNKSSNHYKVSIYRNHSFEVVEHTINLFLNYADINAKFEYSDYDDSLTFFNIDLNADLIILWLDLSRYSLSNVSEFINERIAYLSSIYKKNILFVPFGKSFKLEKKFSNVITYDLTWVEQNLGDKFLDLRLEKFSGTKLSPKASMLISEDLGLNYIPACLKTPIKAVVFDLDNTLYKGVLGEDGINGIELSEGHRKLQEKVVALSKQGFFICIASKNNEEDVVEMFKKRDDFPLKLEHITKLCVSWNSKADSIKEIQKFLNIGISDMLFIDDNMGELATVKAEHPLINEIHAKDDAQITLKVLENYPRMLKLNINYEDLIRKNDTQQNAERERLKNSLSKEEFLKNLEIEITYSLNSKSQATRISELANKTNQFICAYKRYPLKEIEELMNDPNHLIIAVSLKDKLSDSGIIGVLVFANKDEFIEIEECFISCRALGRGIDGNIVLYPIKLASEHFGKNKFKFIFTDGPRNAPAKTFVDTNLAQIKNTINEFNVNVDSSLIKTQVVKE